MALKLQPSFYGAQVGRGDALAAQKKITEAIAAYGEVIKLDPKSTFRIFGSGYYWSRLAGSTRRSSITVQP